jgi:hypothetical protein
MIISGLIVLVIGNMFVFYFMKGCKWKVIHLFVVKQELKRNIIH